LCLQGGADLTVVAADDETAAASLDGGSKEPGLRLQRRDWCGDWALPLARFSPETVGAKSLNTKQLQVGKGHRSSHAAVQDATQLLNLL